MKLSNILYALVVLLLIVMSEKGMTAEYDPIVEKICQPSCRFVIKGNTGEPDSYIDNPKAPFFFKLDDGINPPSYLLFTSHNVLASTLHEKVHTVFEEQTRFVSEGKPSEKPEDLLDSLNAYADESSPAFCEEFCNAFFPDFSALAQRLKPWAAFAVSIISRAQYPGGMDDTFYTKAKEKGYIIDGLESHLDVAKALKIMDLSMNDVMDLLARERVIKESYEDEKQLVDLMEKSWDEGDLIGFQMARTEWAEKYDNSLHTIESINCRSKIWIPEIIRQHQENKGKVFFDMGLAHSWGVEGLLHLLKDTFTISRLTQSGEFLPFEYSPA